jgi:hypothetical protein
VPWLKSTWLEVRGVQIWITLQNLNQNVGDVSAIIDPRVMPAIQRYSKDAEHIFHTTDAAMRGDNTWKHVLDVDPPLKE